MSYVLVWPSEIGPCMARVPVCVFEHRCRVDLHAQQLDRVLRYPPPDWTRVVERPAKQGSAFPGLLAFVLCLAGAFVAGLESSRIFDRFDLMQAPAVLQSVPARFLV